MERWLACVGVAALALASANGSAGAELRRADDRLAQLESSSTRLPDVPSSLPPGVRGDVARLGSGEPFALDQVNMPFMAGIAKQLGESCGLPARMEDRLELAGLVINGSSAALGGNDYANPDLGAAVGNMMGSLGLLMLGVEFARQIPCDSPLAAEMADGLVAASRSNKGGGDAPFIPSYTPVFDEARCACLAQIARGAIPDIYQRHYDRGIINELINRNPLLALTTSASCGIVNY